MKTMRTALHAALVADGRTAVQIAAEAGINAVTLSLLRNGRRTARLETALKLSRALGKNPQDLGLPGIPPELRGGAQ